MAIRQITVVALVFFAVVGITFAASDAPTPSATSKAPAASKGDGAAGGAATDGGAPTTADAAAAGSPTEGPGSESDASTFKVSVVGAFMNVVAATLFFC